MSAVALMKEPDVNPDKTALNEPDIKLRQIARELLAENNDITRATDAFVRFFEEDEAVAAAVRDGCVRPYLNQLIRAAASEDRQIASGDRRGSPSVASLESWSDAVTAGLMDTMRLFGGKLLGDATKADLLTSAGSYRTQADDAAVKGKWLRLIAKAMPNEKAIVRKALTEEKVAAMRTEALKSPWAD